MTLLSEGVEGRTLCVGGTETEREGEEVEYDAEDKASPTPHPWSSSFSSLMNIRSLIPTLKLKI